MKVCVAALCISGILVAWSATAGQDAGSASKRPKDSVYSEIEKAPEKARAKRNPFEQNPDAVSAGKIVFEQHCAECHGETALGGKKAPSLRAVEVQGANPGAIFWILTNGVVRRGKALLSEVAEAPSWAVGAPNKKLGVMPSGKTKFAAE